MLHTIRAFECWFEQAALLLLLKIVSFHLEGSGSDAAFPGVYLIPLQETGCLLEKFSTRNSFENLSSEGIDRGEHWSQSL